MQIAELRNFDTESPLAVVRLAVVLSPAEYEQLQSLGGIEQFIDTSSGGWEGKHRRYQPFQTQIKGHKVILLRGWRFDHLAAFPKRIFREHFQLEALDPFDLPSYARLLAPRLPKDPQGFFVFLDQGRPPQRRLAGKLYMGYHRSSQRVADGGSLTAAQKAVIIPEMFVWVNPCAAIIRAPMKHAPIIAEVLDRRCGQKHHQQLVPVPSYLELLARYSYSQLGYRLTNGK